MAPPAPGRSSAATRLTRALGAMTVALFVAAAFTPLPNLLSRWLAVPARLEPAEAIVVLGGGGVRPDGSLSDTSLRRTLHGMALHRRGLAPLVVFSGPGASAGGSEAEARAAFARDYGIPPTAILTESTARTTRQEAERIGTLLRSRGIRRILVVADGEGMGRVVAVFRREGFEVLAAPTEEPLGLTGTPAGRLEVTQHILQELLARLYYRAAGYI